VGSTEDAGQNLVADPRFTSFTDDGDPTDDDLSLRGSSPGADSGPADGAGPDGYTTWSDGDGSTNDRGHGGGQGGW
jgi:hypothetical protein